MDKACTWLGYRFTCFCSGAAIALAAAVTTGCSDDDSSGGAAGKGGGSGSGGSSGASAKGGTGGSSGNGGSGASANGGTAGRAIGDTAGGSAGDAGASAGNAGEAGSSSEPGSCVNDTQDGDESDVNCGGLFCNPCAVGQQCDDHWDCSTLLCINGTCADLTGNCTNGVQDGLETDADCGGGQCNGCFGGQMCDGNVDCMGNACGQTSSVCCGDTATLSWEAPRTDATGACLTDLAGYRIKWGPSSGNYTQQRDLTLEDPGLKCAVMADDGNRCGPLYRCAHVLTGLSAGMTYFAVSAYDTSNNESPVSNEASKNVIPCE